jgi:primosomal replication protein N
MSRTTFRIAPVALLLASMAACNGTGTEPVTSPDPDVEAQFAQGGADRQVMEAVFDLTGALVSFSCDDVTYSELIRLEGSVQERWAVSITPSGVMHVKLSTKAIDLSGTGMETGDHYQVEEREHAVFHETSMRSGGSLQRAIGLRNTRTGAFIEVVDRFHVNINANGELVVDRDSREVSCQL